MVDILRSRKDIQYMASAIEKRIKYGGSSEELCEAREILVKLLNKEKVPLEKGSNLYLWLTRSPLSTLDDDLLF